MAHPIKIGKITQVTDMGDHFEIAHGTLPKPEDNAVFQIPKAGLNGATDIVRGAEGKTAFVLQSQQGKVFKVEIGQQTVYSAPGHEAADGSFCIFMDPR